MSDSNYQQDLSHIRDIMSKSSRFISLSGLAGIMAGCYALIGAAIAYFYLIPEKSFFILADSKEAIWLVFDLAAIALASIVTAAIITTRKAQKNGEKIWDNTTKRLLFHFVIPLITGGAYILIKLDQQHYGLTAALMLIFYGLSLVNASKYTLSKIQYLGYTEIILGLLCALFPGYGFYFWVLGFGICHILYGAAMYINEK